MSKRSPVKSIFTGICALAGCAFFANLAVVFASSRKNAEKIEKHPHENNYMEAVMLQKTTIEIKPEINRLYYSEGVVVSEFKHVSWGISGVSICPSRRWIVLSVMDANCSSWVTMTKVWPNLSRKSKKS